jgi:ABC-2 type transport system permease protein
MLKRPIVQLILIQLREFYREPGILFWAIVFPIAMAWGLGVAFSHKPDQKRDIALIENVAQPDSLLRSFLFKYSKEEVSTEGKGKLFCVQTGNNKMGFTTYRFKPTTWAEANLLIKQGGVVLIVEEKDGKLNYHFDPMNADAQLTYMQVAGFIKNQTNTADVTEIKPLTQKGTRYIDFLIPGLIAMNLMMSTMWGISYSLIEKRSKKLLRRMVATPMEKTSFLFSQLVARFFLNIIEGTIVFVFAYWYFGLTIDGSVGALFALYLSGMLCFTGIAILVSSRTSNTYVGNGLINAIVMPMMLISGIFFSYHNFPDVVIPYIQAMPLTMLADGMRSIFIEGAGFAQVILPFSVLSAIGIVTFSVGLKIYKWY